ncbi:MAG TPA: hypothetical protein VIN66_14870 [Rheinheimera sp.]|uniref:hypothetical protein n=1 Tax=Rheinheimera sp. TaxID=1869214 RepID=UPI002F91CC46
MKTTILTSISLMFLNLSFAAASEPLKILSYVADPISILDESARLVEKRAAKLLPEPDVDVQAYNEDLDLVLIKTSDGEELWLDTFEIQLNQGKAVNLDCYKLLQAGVKDEKEAATFGFGADCNK